MGERDFESRAREQVNGVRAERSRAEQNSARGGLRYVYVMYVYIPPRLVIITCTCGIEPLPGAWRYRYNYIASRYTSSNGDLWLSLALVYGARGFLSHSLALSVSASLSVYMRCMYTSVYVAKREREGSMLARARRCACTTCSRLLYMYTYI